MKVSPVAPRRKSQREREGGPWRQAERKRIKRILIGKQPMERSRD